jgi:hypothetical protein
MPKFILLTKKNSHTSNIAGTKEQEIVLCADEIEWFQELKNDKLTEIKMKSGDLHWVTESVKLIMDILTLE